jgi:hypothetical protein
MRRCVVLTDSVLCGFENHSMNLTLRIGGNVGHQRNLEIGKRYRVLQTSSDTGCAP